MIGISVWGRTLEPRQFCQKYARLKEGEEGYESVWRTLLGHCLNRSIKTIYRWGPPPEFPNVPERERPQIEQRLAELNALKQSEEVLKRYNLHQEYLDRLE
jgi:hypothetical protein